MLWYFTVPIAVIEGLSPSVRETSLSAKACGGQMRRGTPWLVVGDE